MKHLALFALIGILLTGCQYARQKETEKKKAEQAARKVEQEAKKAEEARPPPAMEKKMTNVVT